MGEWEGGGDGEKGKEVGRGDGEWIFHGGIVLIYLLCIDPGKGNAIMRIK